MMGLPNQAKKSSEATVGILINIIAVPSIRSQFEILSCHSWKPPFKPIQQCCASQIKLIVQSFSNLLFDILECHYSRIINCAGDTARTKVQPAPPRNYLIVSVGRALLPGVYCKFSLARQVLIQIY
ncbi:MAG: hypothetical protein ACI88A_005348 [Paraglaciecola sp.]|jgi:hypothetical protein